MTGLRALLRLVPVTYASLVLDKRSGSDGQEVPAPLGQPRGCADRTREKSKEIHKQLWDIQEGFILAYLSF